MSERRLRQLGLTMVDVPAPTIDIVMKRVEPFLKINLDRLTVHGLPFAIDRIARDCYMQGLMDGAGLGAKSPSIVLGDEDVRQDRDTRAPNDAGGAVSEDDSRAPSAD